MQDGTWFSWPTFRTILPPVAVLSCRASLRDIALVAGEPALEDPRRMFATSNSLCGTCFPPDPGADTAVRQRFPDSAEAVSSPGDWRSFGVPGCLPGVTGSLSLCCGCLPIGVWYETFFLPLFEPKRHQGDHSSPESFGHAASISRSCAARN